MPYARFIVPGLVTLGVVTNAYLNTASSMFVMKIQGTIVDLLVSPLSLRRDPVRLRRCAAVLRGLARGRRDVGWSPAAFSGFESRTRCSRSRSSCSLAAVVFAALGLMTAIWATIVRAGELLPHLLHHAAHVPRRRLLLGRDAARAVRAFTLANPIFYMVDGVRFGMLGISDAPPWRRGRAARGARGRRRRRRLRDAQVRLQAARVSGRPLPRRGATDGPSAHTASRVGEVRAPARKSARCAHVACRIVSGIEFVPAWVYATAPSNAGVSRTRDNGGLSTCVVCPSSCSSRSPWRDARSKSPPCRSNAAAGSPGAAGRSRRPAAALQGKVVERLDAPPVQLPEAPDGAGRGLGRRPEDRRRERHRRRRSPARCR